MLRSRTKSSLDGKVLLLDGCGMSKKEGRREPEGQRRGEGGGVGAVLEKGCRRAKWGGGEAATNWAQVDRYWAVAPVAGRRRYGTLNTSVQRLFQCPRPLVFQCINKVQGQFQGWASAHLRHASGYLRSDRDVSTVCTLCGPRREFHLPLSFPCLQLPIYPCSSYRDSAYLA